MPVWKLRVDVRAAHVADVKRAEGELPAEERRAALAHLVRDVPPVSKRRKAKIRAAWTRKKREA